MASPFQSPLPYLQNPIPLPHDPPNDSADRTPIILKAESSADGPTAAALPLPEGSRSVASIRRRDRAAGAVKKAAIGARVSSAVLCLISFAVMAADKRRGWALDSFNRYNEYRYCVSVNVIGFVYAGLQAYAEVHHLVHRKYIISRPMGSYFDFAMDQILAYLLISASSSATSRTDDWISNWGNDPFPSMINGSVAMSFLAFIAFAVSSLISAYNLFSRKL